MVFGLSGLQPETFAYFTIWLVIGLFHPASYRKQNDFLLDWQTFLAFLSRNMMLVFLLPHF